MVTTGARSRAKTTVKMSPSTNQHPVFFPGRMPFLSRRNQQCHSTEGKLYAAFFVNCVTLFSAMRRKDTDDEQPGIWCSTVRQRTSSTQTRCHREEFQPQWTAERRRCCYRQPVTCSEFSTQTTRLLSCSNTDAGLQVAVV